MMDYEKKKDWEKVLICVGRLREGRMGGLPSSIFLGGVFFFLFWESQHGREVSL